MMANAFVSCLQTKVVFESPCGEVFTARGRRQLDPGFTVLYSRTGRSDGDYDETNDDDDKDEDTSPYSELPVGITAGMQCGICSMKVRQGHTTAPGPLTESELISLMEKHGIGTDASIPTHINNIIVRNYVTLGSRRTLVPTSLGVVLVHGYMKIDPDLVMPEIRSAVEVELLISGLYGSLPDILVASDILQLNCKRAS
jgi:DNA topoisomerase-3